MARTQFPARASALALLLLAACGPGRAPAPTAPAPRPEPAPVATEAPEPIGETFTMPEAPPAPAPVGLLGNARYDLPVEPNRWVEMELDFLVNQRAYVVQRWLANADRYGAWVQDVFAGYGLPRDLHHLAMVESGYSPTAVSRAGAVGMWQFMRATGRGMGLRIDDEVDERRDPVRATHAAARHLRQLHRDFGGDWALAAAAYNAGSGRINRGLGRYGARDFWDLAVRGDLAQETRRYVPRLYAVTIIGHDPARFGFTPQQGPVRRFAYDSVRVDLATPLSELARMASLPLVELTELNPHLLRGTAPAGYWVWVPDGAGASIQQAYVDSDFRRAGGFATYTLRRGETVEEIVRFTGLDVERVRAMNLGTSLERLGRGDRLRLPASAARALSQRSESSRLATRERSEESETAREPSASSAGTTESGADDRVSGLVRTRSSSRAGSERAAPAESRPEPRESSRRSEAGESSRRTESGESSRRSEARESSRSTGSSLRSASSSSGRTHVVEDGQTLWSIARRYDVSVERIREANDLRDETIQPGQRLRIPAASSASASRSVSTRENERVEHVVKSGDTLWSIARLYRSTVEAIRSANGVDDGESLQPGQKLVIPR